MISKKIFFLSVLLAFTVGIMGLTQHAEAINPQRVVFEYPDSNMYTVLTMDVARNGIADVVSRCDNGDVLKHHGHNYRSETSQLTRITPDPHPKDSLVEPTGVRGVWTESNTNHNHRAAVWVVCEKPSDTVVDLEALQQQIDEIISGNVDVMIDWNNMNNIPQDIADGDDVGSIKLSSIPGEFKNIVSNGPPNPAKCPSGSYVSGIDLGYSNDLHMGNGVLAITVGVICTEFEIQSP